MREGNISNKAQRERDIYDAPRQYLNMKPRKTLKQQCVCVCVCVCEERREPVCVNVRVRSFSIPAFPNTPWLTARVWVKAPCRICIPPTGIIPRVESWTRSRNKRACSAAERTTSCAISCCQSSFCSSTLASYHPFSPKAPGR